MMGISGLDDMLVAACRMATRCWWRARPVQGRPARLGLPGRGRAPCRTRCDSAFEQRPNRIRAQVVADVIASGQVGLLDSRASDLSIDEVVFLLMDEIRRLGARRVVIDPLSGFELALAPTFREDFRESLLAW